MTTPKYAVLRNQLDAEVLTHLVPGSPLPPERALMDTYGVSRATVRRALDLLAADGLVTRVQGAGTFVADPATVSKSIALTSFTEDIEARGMRPGSRLLHVVRQAADADIAQDLGLSPGAPIVHVSRLRTADGTPMCVENAWLPAALLPDDLSTLGAQSHAGGRAETSLYALLEAAGIVPETAEQTIRATVVDEDQAAQLGVAPQSPAFLVTRVTRDGSGRAIERGHSVYRADRYDFRITIQRRRNRP